MESAGDAYILLSLVFGFNKSESFRVSFSKEFFMVVFFFVGLLQKNIWNHPYTEHYIEPHFRRSLDMQKSNAIAIVERAHLDQANQFAQQQIHLEVNTAIQERVENKVSLWHNQMSQRTLRQKIKQRDSDALLPLLEDSQAAAANHDLSIDETNDKLEEVYAKQAEHIVLASTSKILDHSPTTDAPPPRQIPSTYKS